MADYKRMYLRVSGGLADTAEKIDTTIEAVEESYTHSDYKQMYLEIVGEAETIIGLMQEALQDAEEIYVNTCDDSEEPITAEQALQQAVAESENA